MAEVVNLRTARKQHKRAADRRRGDDSSARTGADAADSERLRAEAELERRRLDGHRRDRDE
jgi:Domain of unknown function (DUF4169)